MLQSTPSSSQTNPIQSERAIATNRKGGRKWEPLVYSTAFACLSLWMEVYYKIESKRGWEGGKMGGKQKEGIEEIRFVSNFSYQTA